MELDGEGIWEIIDRVREDLYQLETMVATRSQRTRVLHQLDGVAPGYVTEHEVEACETVIFDRYV